MGIRVRRFDFWGLDVIGKCARMHEDLLRALAKNLYGLRGSFCFLGLGFLNPLNEGLFENNRGSGRNLASTIKVKTVYFTIKDIQRLLF